MPEFKAGDWVKVGAHAPGLKDRPARLITAVVGDKIFIASPGETEGDTGTAWYEWELVHAAPEAINTISVVVNPHAPGAKLDEGKIMAGLLADFGLALSAVAEVGTFGAKKYSRGGWQHVENGFQRYTDAQWRHMLAENAAPTDEESGLLNLAHSTWNSLARLELKLREARNGKVS